MSPIEGAGDPRKIDRRLSVAPMMGHTDRHFRRILRTITRRTLLYTEMVTTGAILHGDRQRHLDHDSADDPVALQLGGDDPEELATCAAIGEDAGYAEIDLNVGCPSDRVQKGRFGACLMLRPEVVAECVAAMRSRVDVPVTVKHRIGVDDLDRYEDMLAFVDTVAEVGCRVFVVHARKAWLQGLSPKENRNVPPLRYEDVWRLAEERPDLEIVVNGGIASLEEVREHLWRAAGAMIGRAVTADPYLLAAADREIFGEATSPPDRFEVVARLVPYVESELARGARLHQITRHLLGVFHGIRGSGIWKRTLSTEATRPGAGADVLRQALDAVAEALEPAPAGMARTSGSR